MLKEAKLILPVKDNQGQPLDSIHNRLAIDLCEDFGGFTETISKGLG
jgi:hypothetical protein